MAPEKNPGYVLEQFDVENSLVLRRIIILRVIVDIGIGIGLKQTVLIGIGIAEPRSRRIKSSGHYIVNQRPERPDSRQRKILSEEPRRFQSSAETAH